MVLHVRVCEYSSPVNIDFLIIKRHTLIATLSEEHHNFEGLRNFERVVEKNYVWMLLSLSQRRDRLKLELVKPALSHVA